MLCTVWVVVLLNPKGDPGPQGQKEFVQLVKLGDLLADSHTRHSSHTRVKVGWECRLGRGAPSSLRDCLQHITHWYTAQYGMHTQPQNTAENTLSPLETERNVLATSSSKIAKEWNVDGVQFCICLRQMWTACVGWYPNQQQRISYWSISPLTVMWVFELGFCGFFKTMFSQRKQADICYIWGCFYNPLLIRCRQDVDSRLSAVYSDSGWRGADMELGCCLPLQRCCSTPSDLLSVVNETQLAPSHQDGSGKTVSCAVQGDAWLRTLRPWAEVKLSWHSVSERKGQRTFCVGGSSLQIFTSTFCLVDVPCRCRLTGMYNCWHCSSAITRMAGRISISHSLWAIWTFRAMGTWKTNSLVYIDSFKNDLSCRNVYIFCLDGISAYLFGKLYFHSTWFKNNRSHKSQCKTWWNAD